MRKILLFFPTPFPYSRPYAGTPLSLLAVSRVLARENYEVKIISRWLQDEPEKEILDQAGDSLCLGISAMTGFQIKDGLKIARLVRERHPKLPIIWGGWHASILPEETVRDPHADIVVRGPGDRALPQIVHALEGGGDLRNIPNITYRQNGEVHRNLDTMLENLDDLPPVPYHLVDVEKCLWKTELGDRTISYISSYGCPHRCSFCVEPIVNQRRWKPFSAERVVDEWEDLVRRYHVDSLAVIDSNFFVDKKRVHAICEGLLRRGIKIRWGCANGRVPQLVSYESEIWEAMERSGCASILTGSESGSQEALDYIQKDMDVGDIEKFTKMCAKHRIKVFFSFLVGLPWTRDAAENRRKVAEEYRSTLSLIAQLYRICRRNRFMYYMFLPYPGAPLYDRAVKLGLKAPSSLEGWSNHLLSPDDAFRLSTGQGWMTPKQARLTAMLTQYIFGMLDPDTMKVLPSRFPWGVKRFLLWIGLRLGYFLAALRWRFQWFECPVDYWIFTLIYKFGKVI